MQIKTRTRTRRTLGGFITAHAKQPRDVRLHIFAQTFGGGDTSFVSKACVCSSLFVFWLFPLGQRMRSSTRWARRSSCWCWSWLSPHCWSLSWSLSSLSRWPVDLSACLAAMLYYIYCVQRTVILSYDLLCCSVNHVMNINTLATQVMQKVARKRFYKMKEKNTDDANPQSLNVSTSRSSFSLVYEKWVWIWCYGKLKCNPMYSQATI